MTREELENLKKIVEQEEARLNEEGKEPKVWNPKDGEEVYVIHQGGGVYRYYYNLVSKYDNDMYLQGNMFRTKEEAKFESERRKVIKELQDFAMEHNEPIDWNDNRQSKWYIHYYYFDKKIYTSDFCLIKTSDIYFSSQEIAENAIKQIGEDRIKKYYLRVEE